MKKDRKDLHVQLGKRIKECRERISMTQEQLASAVDVSTQYISDLERGVVGTSLSTLVKICSTLHASSDYILLGQSPDSPYRSELVRRFLTLSPEEQLIAERGMNLLIEAFKRENQKDA